MNFSPMSASEKTGLAVSGDEIGDCIGTLSDGNQIGDQRIPMNAFSNGQGFNLGIINQYGQLMGEYSKLDDELWFSKSEDDEAMTGSDEGHQWNFISAYEQNVDLQKLSNLVDNSVCYGGTAVVKESSSSLKNSSLDQPQTSSPSSILQSVIKRARSKRFRPSKCNSHKALQSLDQNHSFQSESYVKSPPLDEIAEPTLRTKKIDDLLQSGSGERDQNLDAEPTRKRKPSKKAVKKCLHCESTRTPQWREGPMGRATLCNACGVQYRNGRLFAEYRPLSSPTFDPSLHTNVPKKLRGMRMSNDSGNCAVSANSGMAT